MSDVNSQACLYLLTALLQRQEKIHPGLLDELELGVKADKVASLITLQQTLAQSKNKQPDEKFVEAVFDRSLSILHRAKEGNNI